MVQIAAPEEVVASPLTIFLAPVGTAFPEIDDDEDDFPVGWAKLGKEGANNYDDAGVDVAHTEQVNDFTPAGSTMPTKRFRVGESFEIKVNLVDLSPDTYAKVMNDAAITTTPAGAGVAPKKRFSLFRGPQVNSYAVLARGPSPVDNDLNLQYLFSKAFVSVNGSAAWKKGVPTMLATSILAVKHSESDVIDLEIQTGEAS